MDHFNITQICINCLRGKKIFRVDLELYDDNGTLKPGTDRMEKFRFMCQFCWRSTALHFYKFSHPELIFYLKRLHEHYEETKKALNNLNTIFNNIK